MEEFDPVMNEIVSFATEQEVQEEEANYSGCCECGEKGHGCNDCPTFMEGD